MKSSAYRSFTLLLGLLMVAAAYAQPPVIRPTGGMPNIPVIRGGGMATGSGKDTLQRRRNDDSLNLQIFYLDSVRSYRLDSSINDFTHRFPIPATHVHLGNTGTATRSLLFEPRQNIGWDPGFHSLDVYRRKLEHVRFYQTSRPYTEMNYMLASKAEQIIEILHTQNIRPNWNASFNYRMISAPGFFRNQRSSDNSYSFTSWYQGNGRRYNNYFVVLFNRLQAGENGGINNLEDLKDPVFSRDRFTVPTRIGGQPRFQTEMFSTALYTGRRETDMTLFMRQQFDFGRKDSLVTDSNVIRLFFPRVRLEQNFRFKRDIYHYQDYAVQDNKQVNLPDSMYYQITYGIAVKHDSLLIQDRWSEISNDFSIYQYPDEKNLQQFLKFGGELQLIRGELKTTQSLYNFIGHGEYRNTTKNQKWDMLASGRLHLSGYNAGDYRAFISLQRSFQNVGSLKVGFENINRSPSFLFRQSSNFYLDQPRDFAKENIVHFFASVVEPKYRFLLTGDYYLVSNYLYFTDYYKPQQESAIFNVLKLGASKAFRLTRHLNWYADAYVQQKTGAVDLNLPFFFTRNRIAFEGLFFRNLNLSTGLEVRYHSPYKADNYSPVLGQFFYQDSITINNRPDVAAFFHFRIRSFKAYIRAENLNTINSELQFNNHNFSAPAYPTPGFLLRFGIYWSFVN